MTHATRAAGGRLALALTCLAVLGPDAAGGEMPGPAPVTPGGSPGGPPAGLDPRSLAMAVNVAWALGAGSLIIAMKAGFAMMEAGLIRSKNVAHTVAMNLATLAIGMLGFWAVGFALMFGGHGPFPSFGTSGALDGMGSIAVGGRDRGLVGLKGFFLDGAAEPGLLAAFFLHAAMLDTALTIPTGAMAERWKFAAFAIFALVGSTIVYPIFGCWAWGGGWLAGLGRSGLGNGYVDFAGSGVIHLTGGAMALAGAMVLGPRIGKYNPDGSANAIPGHSVPMVAIGTLILAFGWAGLNAGRGFELTTARVASIVVCTALAASSGCVASLATMWGLFGKPDPTMGCNGLLGGAVAIGASCAFVNPIGAVAIGAIAGVLVVASILFVDKHLRVDDPVGAISVHGVCGAFGALGVGLFATGEFGEGLNGVASAPIGFFHGGGFDQLGAQAIGVAANLGWAFLASLAGFLAVERTMGNRVPARAEIEGLDVPEMGVLGYVSEDTYAVRTAGQDYLATFGPGVPAKGEPKSSLGGPKGRPSR